MQSNFKKGEEIIFKLEHLKMPQDVNKNIQNNSQNNSKTSLKRKKEKNVSLLKKMRKIEMKDKILTSSLQSSVYFQVDCLSKVKVVNFGNNVVPIGVISSIMDFSKRKNYEEDENLSNYDIKTLQCYVEANPKMFQYCRDILQLSKKDLIQFIKSHNQYPNAYMY